MRFKTGIIIISILAVIIILNLAGFSPQIKSFFYSFSSSLQKFFWQQAGFFSDFFNGIFNSASLKKENEALIIKSQELEYQMAYSLELQKENKTLREALEIGLRKEFKIAFAQIIARDMVADFLTIDKGKEDGIIKGQAVITEQKALIGKIVEVGGNFSKVLLISNKESSFDGKIAGLDTYGVVKGKGGSKIGLELVPPDKEMKNDDLIVTTALGGVFPEGLLIGKVANAKKLDVEPFQRSEVFPAADPNSLDSVFVIIGQP